MTECPHTIQGIRTLIIEDEPLARRALRTALGEIASIESVREASSAVQAIDAIMSVDPELIFLDVRLPDGTGMDVLRRAKTEAAVIFATAFDDYARIAFELGAIDYLTKPFGPERVRHAVDRAAAQIAMRRSAKRQQFAEGMSVESRVAAIETRPLTTIFARDRGAIVPIRLDEVVHLEADGDFVGVHVGRRRYLVYLNLGDICGQLDPARFIRVHRSHAVNLDAIVSMRPIDPSRVALGLSNGSTVNASRTGTRLLKERMRRKE